MGWQYQVVDLDNPNDLERTTDDLEQAQDALRIQRASYPWPDRLVIQKRYVGDWEPLEGRPQHWEYAITEGPRKAWDFADEPPEEGVGWELDYSRGRPGQAWERFDYTEERYWRRWIGEGERPADEAAPYVTTDGTRLSVSDARRWVATEGHTITWAPENEKLR